ASRRHRVNHGRGLRRDMSFRALRSGQCHIETVVLVDAARARLHVERGEAWEILVVVVHPADMERVARVLALQIAAAVPVRGESEIELPGHEPAPWRGLGLLRP